MRSSSRKILILGIALVAVAFLIYRSRNSISLKGFTWADLSSSIREADWRLLLLSLAAIYVVYFLRALRWARFSHYIGTPNLWNMYRATLMGFTSIYLLGRAGEPIRPLLFARKDKLPVSATFGIYVMERIFDMGSTAILGTVALLAFPEVFSNVDDPTVTAKVRGAGIALLLGLVAGISFLVYFRFHGAGAFDRSLKNWSGPESSGWRHKVAGLFQGFGVGLQSIRTLADLALAIVYSGAHWILVALIYLWIMHAFGGQFGPIDFGGAIVILAFTMVGSAVQLPVVGGGSLAASFFAMTRIFGVDAGPAAIVSIVLYLITFAGCSLAGIPLLLAEGWSMGDLRQMAQAEKKAEAEGTHLHLDNPLVKGEPPK